MADDPSAAIRECREDNNVHSRARATARAGADVIVCERTPVVLDASASRVPDCPGGLQYIWRQGATLVRSASPVATYVPPTSLAGVTSYEVDVSCASSASCPVTDSVTVTVRSCTLAVTFERVVVRGCDGGVEVEWVTVSETDTLGFTVEGAAEPGGPFLPVGELGASGAGNVYRLAVANSETLWYRVVEHTANGRGDVSAAVARIAPAVGSRRTRSRRAPRAATP